LEIAMADLASLNRSVSLDSAGTDFIKYAKLIAAARGKIGEAQRLASASGSRRVADMVELLELNPIDKAAVGVLGLSEALAPYQALAEGFFASMAGFSSSLSSRAGHWPRGADLREPHTAAAGRAQTQC
jgi:hypothetical protein